MAVPCNVHMIFRVFVLSLSIIEGLPYNAEYHRRGSPNAQSEEEKIDPCREQKITNCTKSILLLQKSDLPIHPLAAVLLRSHTCVEG